MKAGLLFGTDESAWRNRDITGYNNGLSYHTQDAALTMLAHLGYLAYHQDTRKVRIPNEEIRLEFARVIREDRHPETYIKLEELPSGPGYADIVYLPGKDMQIPALVVELKWNKGAQGAIRQIREKHYPSVLDGYGGEILLVGINYDRDLKTYACRIEADTVAEG